MSSSMDNFGDGTRRRDNKSANVGHQLEVTLEEVDNGAVRKLAVQKNVICDKCEGQQVRRKTKSYDVEIVRNYIKKKRAERRQHTLEEEKKEREKLEKRKENLQRLYDFQEKQRKLRHFSSKIATDVGESYAVGATARFRQQISDIGNADALYIKILDKVQKYNRKDETEIDSNRSITGSKSQSTVGSVASSSIHDTFAQLTLDVDHKMTHEEECRGNHQLTSLNFQERNLALVEKAQAEMTFLESLKKKLSEKKSHERIFLAKKQLNYILVKLRQSQAALRSTQDNQGSITGASGPAKSAMVSETLPGLKTPQTNKRSYITKNLSPNNTESCETFIQSPLAPGIVRRYDSSGCDDSYIISHSETASGSDLESLVEALADEFQRQLYEVEKLR